MALYTIIFGIVAGLYFYIRTKSWINTGTIFSFYWVLVVFLAYIRLYGLTETSERAYTYIFLGVVCFALGSQVAYSLRRYKVQSKKTFDYDVNNTVVKIACYIIIIYCLYRIFLILSFLSQGYSWWEIRLMSTSGEGGAGTLKGGNLSDVIYSMVVSPLAYLLVPVTVVNFFNNTRDKYTLLLSIIAILLYSIATVSRSVWGFAIIYIVITAIVFRKRFNLTPKQKKLLKFSPIILILLFLMINQITKMRNSESDLILNAYAYLAGGPALFSIQLNKSLSSIRTYGFLSLYGFLQPLFFFLNYFKILSYPKYIFLAQKIKANLETFIRLAPTINMNAYATLFYYFYIDFGVIGIAIGSFIFGLICMNAYINYEKKKSTKSLVILLLLIQFILFSNARIYTSLATRALSFVWIPLVFYRKKLRIRLRKS